MVQTDAKPHDDPGKAAAEQRVSATLLNNLPGMAYRCLPDRNRTMLYASSGCLDLTGYQAEELVRSKVVAYTSLIHEDERESVDLTIREAIAAQRPYRCTYRLTTAEGTQKWVLDKGEAVISGDGSVEALEGFVSDNTERMAAFQLLEQRVADRTRKLSALYDILEVASAPSDLQTTITRSLRRVLRATQGEAGAIHLLGEGGETLVLKAQQDLPAQTAVELEQITVSDSRLAGWVVNHGAPLFLTALSDDPRAAEEAFSPNLNIYLSVPIVANEQVRGVLSVWGAELSRFAPDEEVELLSSVGEQLGVVVENARLRRQAEELMVLEERNRLARELHDSVTQSLYSVTLFAEAGINLMSAGEYARAEQLFPDVLETGRQALKEMRLLVHKLRPSILEEEGLVRAIQHRLSAVEGRAGIKNQLVVEGEMDLSAEQEEALYHVSQEALNNAIKHAGASAVRVYLAQDVDGRVTLMVIDNGQGYDPQAARGDSGLGLVSMRERIESLSGEICYESAPGQGTQVRAELPALPRRVEHE